MAWDPAKDVVPVDRGPEPGGLGSVLPRVRRDAARPADHLRRAWWRDRSRSSTRRRRRRCTRASGGATSCTASRRRATRSAWVLALRRRLPGQVHPRGGGGEHARNQVSAGERYAAVYEINMARCIFCGYCEVACPFDAITMGNDYELADYEPQRPDLHQGDAAGRPARAHPASPRGRVARVVRAVPVLRGRDRGARGGLRRGDAAEPLLQRALAGRAPAVAGRPLPAAAGRVPGRRPGGGLRRRRDGAVRVRGGLHRRRRRAAAARERALRHLRPAVRRRAAVELAIAVLGTGLEAVDTRGARRRPASAARRRSARCC